MPAASLVESVQSTPAMHAPSLYGNGCNRAFRSQTRHAAAFDWRRLCLLAAQRVALKAPIATPDARRALRTRPGKHRRSLDALNNQHANARAFAAPGLRTIRRERSA